MSGPSAAADARPPAGGSKRQPSTEERVARQVARTPNATDAAIAFHLGVCESTVRRYRRRREVAQ